MNMTVLSYSLTGNNDALARSVAQALSAAHIPVTESKTRTIGTIIGDMLFGKTPKTAPAPGCLEGRGIVLLLGPVWMGQCGNAAACIPQIPEKEWTAVCVCIHQRRCHRHKPRNFPLNCRKEQAAQARRRDRFAHRRSPAQRPAAHTLRIRQTTKLPMPMSSS